MPKFYHTAQVFHLFNYNNEMFVRVLNQLRHRQADRLHLTTITPELLQLLSDRGSYPLANYPENDAALTRLLNYARARNITVRVVITPYLPDQLRRIENFPTWRDHLFELGVRREEFFDYSARFDRNDYFRDGVHMNTAGTKKLLQLMLEEGFFQPKATAISQLAR